MSDRAGRTNRPFIIAEAGVNHNGSINIALEMVDTAAAAGVDAIKFQTFRATDLVTASAEKAGYQKKYTGAAESQLEMLRRLELSQDDHLQLAQYCRKKGLCFLSTAFDMESLKFLVERLDLAYLKIGSGEITNGPFLRKHATTGKRIILSTGMATLEEVKDALSVLAHGYLNSDDFGPDSFRMAFESENGRQLLKQNVTLLHCVTEYPVDVNKVNLLAMKSLEDTFGLPVGFSDHSQGILASVLAVSLGAEIIEKHFTLDKHLPGPDHQASLDGNELLEMVQQIRTVTHLLGNGRKEPTVGENENKKVARKTLVAGASIGTGETFTDQNLVIKRAGEGMSPMSYWDMLGRASDRAYVRDEVIVCPLII
jgi:N-acetylneuraminate synthase